MYLRLSFYRQKSFYNLIAEFSLIIIEVILMKPKADVKSAADALRDLKNWVYEYAREFNLDEKAVETLHKKIDEVANKLAGVQCK